MTYLPTQSACLLILCHLLKLVVTIPIGNADLAKTVLQIGFPVYRTAPDQLLVQLNEDAYPTLSGPPEEEILNLRPTEPFHPFVQQNASELESESKKNETSVRTKAPPVSEEEFELRTVLPLCNDETENILKG